MFRVLVALTTYLLSMNMAAAASLAHAVSSPADMIIHGPTFRYILKKDRSPEVCKHMLHVFNAKFAHLWDAPPLPWSKTNHAYSATSKYAFPLLPGVKHDTKATFEMRFSAQPTSPEFSAIRWKQGVGIAGGCPAGKVCPGEELQPILISHFDFDNDGVPDTVIQKQFFGGYRFASSSLEYITVWRNQILTIQGVADLWKLSHPKNRALTPIIQFGAYFRPFIYEGKTYVAQYVQDLGKPVHQNAEPAVVPWMKTPAREDMLLQQYSFSGAKDKITGMPRWTIYTICDLQMAKQNNW